MLLYSPQDAKIERRAKEGRYCDMDWNRKNDDWAAGDWNRSDWSGEQDQNHRGRRIPKWGKYMGLGDTANTRSNNWIDWGPNQWIKNAHLTNQDKRWAVDRAKRDDKYEDKQDRSKPTKASQIPNSAIVAPNDTSWGRK